MTGININTGKKRTITIIGAGMMGSAMSIPARDNGHRVRLVGTHLDRGIIERARSDGFHIKMERTLPAGIEYYQFEELGRALDGCDIVICGVSSFGVDWFGENIVPVLSRGVPVLSVTKGLLDLPGGSLRTFPDILSGLPAADGHAFCAVGGPCTSYELADRHQTSVVFCGPDTDLLRELKSALTTPYYHISLSNDITGVETAVALKNAYALAVTLAVGLAEANDPGGIPHYNTQAALFGQAVWEMSHIIAGEGGGEENIKYAAGDLYVTIFGGRTRKIGTLLGRGLSFDEAMAQLDGITLESVVIATRVCRAMRARIGDELSKYPLLAHIGELINGGARVDIPWERFVDHN